MQKDKKGLLDNPKQIKDIFVKRFKAVLEENVSGYNYVSDSTSVITAKLIRNDKIEFSFDVAIIVEGDDGYFYRLTHDKRTNRYIWNQVANSKNYFAKFKAIKENGYWMEFKQRYLKNKDRHLSNQDGVKSFSIFLETLNEFYR